MISYLIRRILLILPVAFAVSVIAFVLVQLSPGDPSSFFIGPDTTPEQVEQIRQRLGVDAPLYVQFVQWLSRTVRGDLGVSFIGGRTVIDAYTTAFPVTFLLAAMSLIFAIVIALPIGMLSALRPGTLGDKVASGFVFLGVSLPNFWFGMLLVIFISIPFGIFPAQGYDDATLFSRLHSLALPAVALGYAQAALMARMLRTSMLEVLREDYVTTARAKGLRYKVVLLKHAFANAFNPVLTVIGLSVVSLISGSVVVEAVFNLPGLGTLVINAISRRDYPVIQGVLLLTAGVVIIINLVVDFLYAALDPRIRYD